MVNYESTAAAYRHSHHLYSPYADVPVCGTNDGVKYKTDEQRPRLRVPEAGNEGPAAFNLSGGGGAGRFGRVRV